VPTKPKLLPDVSVVNVELGIQGNQCESSIYIPFDTNPIW